MQVGPGAPVDMDAIDAMAATATEGADKADEMWQGLQDGFLRTAGQGRAGSFSQGALAGRTALPITG